MQGCRQQLRPVRYSIKDSWDLGFENIVVVCASVGNFFIFLVSSLIKICHLHNISLLFLNHASTIFVTQDVFVILLMKLLPAPLLVLSLILKLTIVTLFYSIYLLKVEYLKCQGERKLEGLYTR